MHIETLGMFLLLFFSSLHPLFSFYHLHGVLLLDLLFTGDFGDCIKMYESVCLF